MKVQAMLIGVVLRITIQRLAAIAAGVLEGFRWKDETACNDDETWQDGSGS